jgi:cytochrome c556
MLSFVAKVAVGSLNHSFSLQNTVCKRKWMKKRTAISLLCLAAGFSTLALADEQSDFVAWMKTTAGNMGKMKKGIDAKEFEGVATQAGELEGIFKNVEAYFVKTHTEDAAKMSKDAAAASAKLMAAAKSGDADAAAAGLKGVQATCGGCHSAHREKLPEGGYKIK